MEMNAWKRPDWSSMRLSNHVLRNWMFERRMYCAGNVSLTSCRNSVQVGGGPRFHGWSLWLLRGEVRARTQTSGRGGDGVDLRRIHLVARLWGNGLVTVLGMGNVPFRRLRATRNMIGAVPVGFGIARIINGFTVRHGGRSIILQRRRLVGPFVERETPHSGKPLILPLLRRGANILCCCWCKVCLPDLHTSLHFHFGRLTAGKGGWII